MPKFNPSSPTERKAMPGIPTPITTPTPTSTPQNSMDSGDDDTLNRVRICPHCGGTGTITAKRRGRRPKVKPSQGEMIEHNERPEQTDNTGDTIHSKEEETMPTGNDYLDEGQANNEEAIEPTVFTTSNTPVRNVRVIKDEPPPEPKEKKKVTKRRKLKAAQERMLRALAEADPGCLNRYQLVELAPVDPGWISSMMGLQDPAKRPEREARLGYPSLLTLGLVEQEEIDVEGVSEWVYNITPKGKEFFVDNLLNN